MWNKVGYQTCVYTVAPTRREALTFPPSLLGKGVRGLGFALAFPHNVKSQEHLEVRSVSGLIFH